MTEHSTLPLAKYDQLPLGPLAHRVCGLDAGEVRTLVAYETEHADRRPVLKLLRSRLHELEQGATPSLREPADSAPPRP